ncbi:2,5-diamino-6-(5-phosphoribosylamino)pyrimidin-4(3H)-one reductase [Halobiforma haloterrestris]|uniref:2,5-diamino-6-(ribosylamino)-4(3H)-pyrimidinone 5'-phosphate reductase n=1 Tax=Natronobacterium haloterrestre TaxID=148448 RepID=A0A1I1GA84_NATHA|nr:2,5-diamino-6-(ribosylamino)-4(3H)-pyrimidinone 5'-phosphate reductase [Halobiforma haloterrestris]SFC06060.1 2,5-diamino-6-(5-phosphoribosylamino)pyrimidin-4(3H)-one reductase [Halobiforma haloterrestris]
MHVVVNAAVSADGKLSSRRREQIAISGEADFDRVDRLRADSDAVVVGVGTVLADDPSLTVKDAERRERRREAGKPGNPARVVVDSRARTPPDAEVVNDAATTYVCVSEAAPVDRRLALSERPATELVTAGEERVDLLPAFAALQEAGLERLMVEGGGELIFSLFEAGLVDELRAFVGPKVIGGRDAPTLADGEGFVEEFPRLALEDVERIDEGVLLSWRVEPDTTTNDGSEP